MEWEQIGAIGELIGALAVLATLLYLAKQIHQSSETSRIANYHGAQEQLWAVAGTIASDPDLSKEIAMSLTKRLSDLKPVDRVRMDWVLNSFLFGMENMFALHEKGQIESEQWQNVFANNFGLMGSQLMRDYISSRPGPSSRKLESLVAQHAAKAE
jgi:hypothetical protein